MKMRKQEPPFCVGIETSYGCNLQCPFCGIVGTQEAPGKDLHYMTLATAKLVATRLADAIAMNGWNPRIEITGRGEPTMNPNIIEIVKNFRRYLPKQQLLITSNGGGLLRKPGALNNVSDLFDAGLNILILDDYKHARLVPKIREALDAAEDGHGAGFLTPLGNTVTTHDYPAEPQANPHRRYDVKTTRFVAYVQDISEAKKGVHNRLNNHAGHSAELDFTYNKRCFKPFREVTINFDGNIDLCCIDWVSEYRIGSLQDHTLEELWQGDAFNAARQYLYRGERGALRPCAGCTHPGYRLGLLPDPRGKATLPKPTAATAATVRRVLGTGPHEKPTALAKMRIGWSLPDWLKKRWGVPAKAQHNPGAYARKAK